MNIRFWAGLDSQASTEKKMGADYEQLLRAIPQFFYVFMGKKNIVASTLKSYIENWKKSKILESIFFPYFYGLLWNLKFQCKL